MSAESSEKIINALFDLLTSHGEGDYFGESISQLDHSLQAAHLAKQAGAADTTVAAALLHDCGQIIPLEIIHGQLGVQQRGIDVDMILPSGESVGRHEHDHIGASYLASLGFPSTVCELVHDHVVAKRYLTAVEDGYYENLSKTSKNSLQFQGGPFSPEQIHEFEQDHLFAEKVAMRRFDDAAKIVGAEVPNLEAYRPVLERALSHH
ncbi:hypothetical protein VKT23_013888 [Stygiomarasmius scandens]|uniref:HD domain-containing protein n=1 Tax=Marasmiellus scandens TaxID=2682957 RepID=A0ABR1J4R3_9AGAR